MDSQLHYNVQIQGCWIDTILTYTIQGWDPGEFMVVLVQI